MLGVPPVVENRFVSVVTAFVALDVVLLAAPPLLDEELLEDEFVDAAVMVTALLDVSEPPALPDTESDNVQVPADEPAVTVQLTELCDKPLIVPTVFVAVSTVQEDDGDIVAATEVEEPAVSVPEL